jgi:hypothetical protein
MSEIGDLTYGFASIARRCSVGHAKRPMVALRSGFVSLSRLSLARVCTSRANTPRETRRETITECGYRPSTSTSSLARLHGKAEP